MTTKIELTGQRFTRLLVTGPAEPTPAGQARWMCQCDCGTALAVISPLADTLNRDAEIDRLRRDLDEALRRIGNLECELRERALKERRDGPTAWDTRGRPIPPSPPSDDAMFKDYDWLS